MKCRRLPVLLLVSCASLGIPTVSAYAQEKDKADRSSPQALVASAIQTQRELRFADYAALFHPDELARFQKGAADYFELLSARGDGDQLKLYFSAYQDAEAIRSAPAVEVVENFARAPLQLGPFAKKMFANMKLKQLGEIKESEEMVHVVIEINDGGPTLLSCRKDEDQWHLLPTKLMEMAILDIGLADGFKDFDEYLQAGSYYSELGLNDAESSERMMIDKAEVEVLGHLPPEGDAALVVYRAVKKTKNFSHRTEYTLKMQDVLTLRKSEPAWKHLSGDLKALARSLTRPK